ncbi:transposase IS4 family protein [Hymenobacter roseosalivarius DSM 11622]|uniref:Transposase IS4 family protein n=1 Tax=Hymenobacter roseosalivarius DSM 11622 TaxID=645990 RepID=A0A1W1UER4_9BACT|nr:IS1182 family transposase [Hymenobacter roseosalivarius]SMB79586.1 transposase IS4 family protein [Hymenobacter roseosalivarius DSM 11622]
MQGHKHFTDKASPQFRLSERVPRYNLYHRLRELLDWDFLYHETQLLYGATGRPSLDPVVFFKLLLVGRLENIISDRRLVGQCALRLDILYFLGYEVDEDLPWHSTISRTRQRYPTALFERLFDWVFAQCVAQGLVAGERQAIDSAPVKANASLDSLQEKRPAGETAPGLSVVGKPVEALAPAAVRSAPAHQLRREAARQAKRQQTPDHLGARHAQARLVSNKTHYSPTDPEARISVKPGKARALNYLCSLAVDTGHGLITHVQADLADSRDSLHLPRLLTGLQQRLRTHELTLRDLLADAGYANGSNYALLERQRITAWIPVFGQYKPVVEGFTYDVGTDSFTCPAAKTLSFKHYEISADGGWVKLYSAAYADCKQCARKPTCIAKAKCKRLTRTIYDAAYQRAWQRQQSRRGQYLRRVRQSTVEPVFGTLLHHYGLRRLNPRGLASAHKTMLLTALAYNLKKLLTHRPQRTQQLAVALPLPRLPTADQPWAQAA